MLSRDLFLYGRVDDADPGGARVPGDDVDALQVLRAAFPAGTTGAEAVTRLARAEELASYGPGAGARDDDLPATLRTARRELVRAAGRRARVRAACWPASLPAALRAGLPAWTRRLPELPRAWRRV